MKCYCPAYTESGYFMIDCILETCLCWSGHTKVNTTPHWWNQIMIGNDVTDSGALSVVNVSMELCRAPMFGTPVSHARFITLLGQGTPMSGLLWSEGGNEISVLCCSFALSQPQEADTSPVSLPVYKEECSDISEGKCKTVEKGGMSECPQNWLQP